MPAKSVVIAEKADKQLSRLPKRIQLRFAKLLTDLQKNPLLRARLSGDLAGSYKLRIGDYRVIYDFHTKQSILVVLKIEHRQGVYR